MTTLKIIKLCILKDESYSMWFISQLSEKEIDDRAISQRAKQNLQQLREGKVVYEGAICSMRKREPTDNKTFQNLVHDTVLLINKEKTDCIINYTKTMWNH